MTPKTSDTFFLLTDGLSHPHFDAFLLSLELSKSRLRIFKFSENSISSRFRSHRDRATVFLDTVQEPLTKTCLGRGVDFLPALDAEVEGPKKFGDTDEEVTFC